MSFDLTRLLKPNNIALFGGAWASNVIRQLKKAGYSGEIWPIHPERETLEGMSVFRSIEDLPASPDAAFIGVNREATVAIVQQLNAVGAGGAICFASGFLESESESEGGAKLQQALVKVAGGMPILGPNCYGLLNYLDNVTLWPDEHGGIQVENGVAIIAQSSNVAINMTMQEWGLPIAYMLTAGNQAQVNISELAKYVLKDERVTALGLYIEGFENIRDFEEMAQLAGEMGKSVVALKVGRSEKSKLATLTHTASLAGGAAASSALFKRLGIAEVKSVGVFLETLKILHMCGPLASNEIASISCSGGEASLMADLGEDQGFNYRDFSAECQENLKSILGPQVTIANPLDYHTYIWGDVEKMSDVFSTVLEDDFALSILVLDLPRDDRCDPSSFDCALEAIENAKAQTDKNVAVLASLPNGVSEAIVERLAQNKILTLHSFEIGLAAIECATRAGKFSTFAEHTPLFFSDGVASSIELIDEAASKKLLGEFGLKIPKSVSGVSEEVLYQSDVLEFPVALKALGVAHKSEMGAVKLNINSKDELEVALLEWSKKYSEFLVEEMQESGVAEIILGVVRDETGMFTLTIGAGGTLTELLNDKLTILLPTSREAILGELKSLKIWPILEGYRSKVSGDVESLFDAIDSVTSFVDANANQLVELDINPFIVQEKSGVAVDALIIMQKK